MKKGIHKQEAADPSSTSGNKWDGLAFAAGAMLGSGLVESKRKSLQDQERNWKT